VRRAALLLVVVGLLAVGGGTYRAVQDGRRGDACGRPHTVADSRIAPSLLKALQVRRAYSSGTVGSAAEAEDQLLTPSQPLQIRIDPAAFARYRSMLDTLSRAKLPRPLLVACLTERR
jgi:hypothetical protein